ncbi:hypothetical protein EV426DRAFT_702637 [Tirmania nivea]|nr:hypothetical protein EV426DRAFT_702637 [Tirmania nivea]
MPHGSESQGGHHNMYTILPNNNVGNHTTPIAAQSNIVPWPAVNCITVLATSIRDRILELEGIEHTACIPEAMEDNIAVQIRNLESLVDNYSQVTKHTLALGGIIWPNINHSTFNLPAEVKLRKLQNIQRDFALLRAFSQRLLTSPERNQIASFSLSDPIASCSREDRFSTISDSSINFKPASPSTGCYTSADQMALLRNNFNPKEKRLMSSPHGILANNSEDLNDFNDTSSLAECATGIAPPQFVYQPERVYSSVLDGGPRTPYAETGMTCYGFPDSQIINIDISTTTGSSKYLPRVLQRSNGMVTRQGTKLGDISFEEPLVRPLHAYQDGVTFLSGSYQIGERTAGGTLSNGEHMNDNGNSSMRMCSWKYSIGEPPGLPHFYGNGGPSALEIENAGGYHQSRSSVTHHSSPDTYNCHTHLGTNLTGGRPRTGQAQLQSSPRRYLCPIPSCPRNRTNLKRVLRSDNLGDHLRKVHKLEIPARTRIVSWVLANSSLLREVDEQMQVLHGRRLQ